DFVADDGFKVHTRWIETDFANTLAASVRAEPLADVALVRTAIEIDGRRMALGLPAALLNGLRSTAGAVATASPIGANEEVDPTAVAAPVAGTLQAWKVADGDTVAVGDTVATMEAMKMEMQVTAHRAGRITLRAAQGAYVAAGAGIAAIA
ncbi:MAG: acetyl-CoA carboxylase biotin carboxyl carrier protein subunit, partial [Pseudomonadota bacterium]